MKQIQKGFTLIELMIVVAIIGILAAVAIPAYSDYTTKAKLSKVQSTLDSLKTALAMSLQENGSFPIATTAISVTSPGGASVTGTVWNTLGFTTSPLLPAEVAQMDYITNATGSSFVLWLKLANIRANTIDGKSIAISPVASDNTVIGSGIAVGTAPAATAAVAGSTAMVWHYGCTTGLDAIAVKAFGNCS